ncbi:MAG: enoyl-CoA hydratase/isomerase family protein [Dehalococcoidia bacterium]|nr:enoyl-CoA hydratase/isomerase family protein [Dehalococcoidia bacterium]
MQYEQILYEQRGRVSLITLNRPEKLNAWTDQMRQEMVDAMDRACAEPSVGAIVITGAGRAFCAGADIGGFKANMDAREAGRAVEQSPATRPETNWVTYLQTLPKPTIAAVNGTAVGIGVTQILPCDIRVAAEDARFGMFFVRMGLVPELASSALLPQMVGSARALEWCLTGRLIPAEEARAAGLISEVVPGDSLIERALALGEQLSENSQPSMRLIRRLLRENATATDVVAVMKSEGEALNEAYRTWEHKEAITAFMEKRKANFIR